MTIWFDTALPCRSGAKGEHLVRAFARLEDDDRGSWWYIERVLLLPMECATDKAGRDITRGLSLTTMMDLSEAAGVEYGHMRDDERTRRSEE